jgi:ribosomal protein L12E/L44/L45/RPP1/RPP2
MIHRLLDPDPDPVLNLRELILRILNGCRLLEVVLMAARSMAAAAPSPPAQATAVAAITAIAQATRAPAHAHVTCYSPPLP